jgi:UDP-N-acetylglucosamine diphosphorylase/glucosamine-1-phosphate N-acetyltransferase
MHVVIFEGNRWNTFAPMTLSRPAFMLFSGMGTLLDKVVRHLRPSRLTLWVRPEFVEYARTRIVPKLKVPCKINEPLDDEVALICSARELHFSRFEPPGSECVAVEDGGIGIHQAYAKRPGLSPDVALTCSSKWLEMLDLPRTIIHTRLAQYVWDLISWNEESLVADSLFLDDSWHQLPKGPYHAVNDDNVWVAKDASIAPGVVLDAAKGPVVIGRAASIGANSVLIGPCYVGDYTRVSPLSIIRSGTSIGPLCKVGGEISNSIIAGYSNKAHEGYLGDSYVGEWVNLGAGTTTSNVKNTYGEVSVTIGQREINTERRSMGSLIGDHTTTSIGTRLTTGAYVGYNCLLAGSGLVPKFVPSFSFWTPRGMEKFDLKKASDVARRVLDRRDKVFGPVDEDIMRYIERTAPSVEV